MATSALRNYGPIQDMVDSNKVLQYSTADFITIGELKVTLWGDGLSHMATTTESRCVYVWIAYLNGR